MIMLFNQLGIVDGEHHNEVCTLCGHTVTHEHRYDGVCDAICDDCGYERVAPHAFAMNSHLILPVIGMNVLFVVSAMALKIIVIPALRTAPVMLADTRDSFAEM